MTGNKLDEGLQQQVRELNTYVTTRIAPSKIHGVGVFALRDMKKGTKLYADLAWRLYTLPFEHFDKIYPEVADIIQERNPQVVNGSNFVVPDTRVQAYMNHSDKPNYDAVNDVLLEDVGNGDEILEDYKKIEGWEKVFPWLKV